MIEYAHTGKKNLKLEVDTMAKLTMVKYKQYNIKLDKEVWIMKCFGDKQKMYEAKQSMLSIYVLDTYHHEKRS